MCSGSPGELERKQSLLDEAQEKAFLRSSQLRPLLLVRGPHSEEPGIRGCRGLILTSEIGSSRAGQAMGDLACPRLGLLESRREGSQDGDDKTSESWEG